MRTSDEADRIHPETSDQENEQTHLPEDNHHRNANTAGAAVRSRAGSSPAAAGGPAAGAVEAMRMMTMTVSIPGDPVGGAQTTADQEEGDRQGEGEIPQETHQVTLPADQADRAARPWIQDSAFLDRD